MADDRQSLAEGQRLLRVGCCSLGPHPDRYFRRFSALEYQQTFFEPPGTPVLERLRRLAPRDFSFFVKAWQLITHEPSSPGYRRLAARKLAPLGEYGLLRSTPAVLDAYRATLVAASTLGATGVVFETSPSFFPSARSRADLSHFFETVERPPELMMVWDPRGLWSCDDALKICSDLQLVLAWDPFRDRSLPPTSVAYLRVQGMGRTQHFSDFDLEWLASARQHNECVYCLFQTVEMHRDATRLLAIAGLESAEEPSDPGE